MIEIMIIKAMAPATGYGVSITLPGKGKENFMCADYVCHQVPGWIEFRIVDGAKDSSVTYRYDVLRLYIAS
jgi:hypothetical protein